MIRQVKIRNKDILTTLDVLAQDLLKLPATYKGTPKPDTSLATLRSRMAGEVKYSCNMVDYTGRQVSWIQKKLRDDLLKEIGYKEDIAYGHQIHNARFTTMGIQPAYFGWSGWENNPKGQKTIRFIWNSGKGATKYVKEGKYVKIPDTHNVLLMKNWSCLGFYLEDNMWISDRNYGDTPRVVIDFTFDGYQIGEFAYLLDCLENRFDGIAPQHNEVYGAWKT